MQICFAGDVFLGGDLKDKPAKGVVRSHFFNSADIRVVNLEQPISDSAVVADKCTLHTGSYATKQLKDLGVYAVNLAHNHVQDKGLEGIVETVAHLNNAGISSFGAGADIGQAGSSVNLDEDTVILGYCEFGKSYLRQIQLADVDQAGVNPLRYEKIIDDLDALPVGKKAVLYFHWGREHVWLPPSEDIHLAKKLLEDNRVLLIVGMHAHRAQGYIEHCGKRAYMCLGNFIFPNFYISPPTQIYYPEWPVRGALVTRQYHAVRGVAYKKWKWVNRLSIVVNFNTQSKKTSHSFVFQDDDAPVVGDVASIFKPFLVFFIYFLSVLYRLPKPVYVQLERLSSFLTTIFWRGGVLKFKLKQAFASSIKRLPRSEAGKG